MNLNEHQAKNILRELGFSVPAGVVCDSADMAEVLATTLDTQRWVVKAQIFAGGRARGYFAAVASDEDASQGQIAGNQGGIRFADSVPEVVSHCRQMIGGTLITEQTGNAGEYVSHVYLEERCEVARECYLALTIDHELGQLVFIVSNQGGSDIEAIASEQPDSVQRFPVRLDQPFDDAPSLATALGLDGQVAEHFSSNLHRLLDEFVEKDMLLVEINPLAIRHNGELLALDATVVFDDNALFRQGHPEQMEAYIHLPDQEYSAAVQGLNLVKLDGDIATLSAGAGLAMATIDAICENGGTPANFLDVPPSTAVARLRNAVTLLLHEPGIACLLVNVFGGGIMRCDAVADALLLAHREAPFTVPVVVRLAGTNAALGRQRLAASLPDVIVAPNLSEAARVAVAHAAAAADQSTGADEDLSAAGLWGRIRRLLPDKTT